MDWLHKRNHRSWAGLLETGLVDITHLWDWQESTACDTPTVVWADLRMFYLRASALDALVALNCQCWRWAAKLCLIDVELRMAVTKISQRGPVCTEKQAISSFFWVLYKTVEEGEFQSWLTLKFSQTPANTRSQPDWTKSEYFKRNMTHLLH